MNWNDEEQWKEATVRKKTTVEASKRCSKSYVRRKGYNEATKEEKLLNVSVQKEVVESKWKAMKSTNDGVERE